MRKCNVLTEFSFACGTLILLPLFCVSHVINHELYIDPACLQCTGVIGSVTRVQF